MEKVEIKDEKEKSLLEFRGEKYEEVRSLIEKRHSGSERKNLLAFSGHIVSSFTDYHFVKGMGPENLYQLILNYQQFFIQDLQALDTSHPDLQPASIKIFNPSDEPAYEEIAGHLEVETTVIQVHTKDAPFIFESIWKYLKKKGFHIFNAIHPVLPVSRKQNKVVDIYETPQKTEKDVFINIFMEKVVNENNRLSMELEIKSVLTALFLAINDFGKMLGTVENLITEKQSQKSPGKLETAKEKEEHLHFLKWLIEENFIFMGIRNYATTKKGKKVDLVPDESLQLGVFRDLPLMDTIFPGQVAEVEERLKKSLANAAPITVDFFNTCSNVLYHFDPIDAIAIENFNDKGETASKTLLFGRFSRGGMLQKSSNVPILREKIKKLLGTGSEKTSSYYRREFFTIFNQLPKREIFYLDLPGLCKLIELILSVQSDESAEIFIKNDRQDSYLSFFIIFSRSKYSREVRERIKDLLKEKLKQPITRWENIDCLPNTVLVFFVDTRDAKKLALDVAALEKGVKSIITTWGDKLNRSLVQEHGDRSGFALYNKYKKAFKGLYLEITDVKDAVYDVRYLEELEINKKVRINIFPANHNEVEIKLYSYTKIDLMTIIPTAQNMGLYVTSEQVHALSIKPGKKAYIHIFKISGDDEFLENILEKRSLVSEILAKIMAGQTVNDRLNHLVLWAGFNWKAVELFRAVKSYLLQIDSTYSPNSIDDVLIKFVDITKKMFVYFGAKFKPKAKTSSIKDREKLLEARESEFHNSLSQVSSLMEDQIFRGLFDIMKNMLRTNFYKSADINYISFKVDCLSMVKLPSPRPLYEIYVHSPELEGVHLRGGKVARGGLRWSDRYDDFRTEVLGLMKTQMVKNTVIVPFGSKGGFVLKKRDLGGGKERDNYIKKQYQTFISGLLDITDNIKAGKTVPPTKVVSYDDHDPYLVVAADKGTAKLSDAANEVSEKYHFWLGDAFASGGAIGYDHKKEGITARGAWECVKRHFREKGIDIQKESIRVAGIGDMGGDVFGNGMLLSQKIKLVAAFNHIHIFLDPNPDPEKSWNERKRLFENPRLKWTDYSSKLISKGGGVYPRSSKGIVLSKEAKEMLGIEKSEINGEELIQSLLTMEVDLLWNGGIGTYVKSTFESDTDVGDRSNDRVRVNAKDLRAKVLGEGGNLGITQLGRIEASKHGVICNTDAIDNSGGVDMSDHEVNLKILLSTLMENDEIKSQEERNELFVRVTDEVAEHVLLDNYLQSAVISLDQIRSEKKVEPFLDLIDRLSALGILDRREEFIPNREELTEQRNKYGKILRPIMAVLLGYSKMYVYQKLLHSKLMDMVFVEQYLDRYFPDIFHREYPTYVKEHRLRREIISSVITNKMVNQTGAAYFFVMEEKTGKETWEIARAYIIIGSMLKASDFRDSVYKLDNIISSELQHQMLIDLEGVLFQLAEWMLTNMSEDRISFDLINLYQGVIVNFKKNLVDHLETVCSLEKGCMDSEVQKLVAHNVPKDLAETYVVLPYLKDVLAILKIKEELHYNFIDTGNLYIKLNHYLYLDWVEENLKEIDSVDEWEEKASENLYEELKDYQNRIVVKVLNFKRHNESIDDGFQNYMEEKDKTYLAYKERVDQIKESGKVSLVSFSVLVRSLKDFL